MNRLVQAQVAVRHFDGSYQMEQVEAGFTAGEWFVHKPVSVPSWYIQKWSLSARDVARMKSGWCVTHATGFRAAHLTNLVDAKTCCRGLKLLKLEGIDDKPGLKLVKAALAARGVLAGQMDQRCGEAVEVAS